MAAVFYCPAHSYQPTVSNLSPFLTNRLQPIEELKCQKAQIKVYKMAL